MPAPGEVTRSKLPAQQQPSESPEDYAEWNNLALNGPLTVQVRFHTILGMAEASRQSQARLWDPAWCARVRPSEGFLRSLQPQEKSFLCGALLHTPCFAGRVISYQILCIMGLEIICGYHKS